MERPGASDDISVRLAWPDEAEDGSDDSLNGPFQPPRDRDPEPGAPVSRRDQGTGYGGRAASTRAEREAVQTPPAVMPQAGSSGLVPELVPQFESLQSILASIALRVDALATAVSTLRGVVTDRVREYAEQVSRLAAGEAEALEHQRTTQEQGMAELRRVMGGGNDALRRIAMAIEEMSATMSRVLEEVPGAAEGLRQAEERQDQLARWLGSSLVHTRQQLTGKLDVIQALLVEGTGAHVEGGQLPDTSAIGPTFASAVASLQEDLATRVAEVEALRHQAAELREVLLGGEASLETGVGQLSALVEGERKREEGLGARLDRLTAILQTARDREGSFQAAVGQLASLVEAADRREGGLVALLGRISSVVETAAERENAMVTRLSALMESAGQRESGLAARLSGLVDTASRRESTVETKLAQLAGAIESGRQREIELEARLGDVAAQLGERVKGADERQRALEAKLDALIALVEETGEEEVDLEGGLQELSGLVKAAGEREASIVPLLRELTTAVEGAAAREGHLEEELEDLREEAAELRKEVVALRRRTAVKSGSPPVIGSGQIQAIARAVVAALDEPPPAPPPPAARPLRPR